MQTVITLDEYQFPHAVYLLEEEFTEQVLMNAYSKLYAQIETDLSQCNIIKSNDYLILTYL